MSTDSNETSSYNRMCLLNYLSKKNMPNILDKFLDVDKLKYNFLQLEQISRHKYHP